MWDILLDSALDSIKLFPFLFITYLLMEYLEHKAGKKANAIIGRAGRLGPLFGGMLGVVPQCGFSAAASNLYAGRVITIGTLVAIFLSTSDEMLPVMISEQLSVGIIVRILVMKVVTAVLAGSIIDMAIYKRERGKSRENDISHLCEHEHCHCEKGIFRSALKHSLQILFFIFCVNLILGTAISVIGEERLMAAASGGSVVSIFLMALVGMIPNCAASVVITELYLGQVISTGAMMAGLLAGNGVGLLVLFRMNRNLKENLIVASIIYVSGVISGLTVELIGISFF